MELKAGLEVPYIEMSRVTREQIRAYAEASGDYNKIHLDDAAARAVGLPSVIAHGMLVAALIGERAQKYVAEDLKRSDLKSKSFRARFKAMTFPDDVISVGGQVREWDGKTLLLSLSARNQKGETVTVAWTEFAV